MLQPRGFENGGIRGRQVIGVDQLAQNVLAVRQLTLGVSQELDQARRQPHGPRIQVGFPEPVLRALDRAGEAAFDLTQGIFRLALLLDVVDGPRETQRPAGRIALGNTAHPIPAIVGIDRAHSRLDAVGGTAIHVRTGRRVHIVHVVRVNQRPHLIEGVDVPAVLRDTQQLPIAGGCPVLAGGKLELPMSFLQRHRGAIEATLRLLQQVGLFAQCLLGEDFSGDVARRADGSQGLSQGVAEKALMQFVMPYVSVDMAPAHERRQGFFAVGQRLFGGETNGDLVLGKDGFVGVGRMVEPGEAIFDIGIFAAGDAGSADRETDPFQMRAVGARTRVRHRARGHHDAQTSIAIAIAIAMGGGVAGLQHRLDEVNGAVGREHAKWQAARDLACRAHGGEEFRQIVAVHDCFESIGGATQVAQTETPGAQGIDHEAVRRDAPFPKPTA